MADGELFDCCVHLLDIFQETEGIDTLLKCMEENRVTRAAVCGTPVTKKWDNTEKERPKGAFQDTGRVYFFTATDEMIADELQEYEDQTAIESKIVPMACGFNPTDNFACKHLKRVLTKFPGFWGGVGELYMRYSEISMLTNEEVTRCNHPAMRDIYKLCSEKEIPVVVHSNASSESAKPYAVGYEYTHEFASVLEEHRNLKMLLNGCGMFERGKFQPPYEDELMHNLVKYPNLFLGITSWNIEGCKNAMSNETLVKVVDLNPTRFVLSTDCPGNLLTSEYNRRISILRDFVRMLKPETQELVMYKNAEELYRGRVFGK